MYVPRQGREGEDVPHHRYIASFDVVMAEPNAASQPAPTQAPADLANDLRRLMKESKPKKNNGNEYIVEKVTRVAARTTSARKARTTARGTSSKKTKRKK